MAIVLESEVRVALGLFPKITEAQIARLMLAIPSGHAAVRKFLKYDPEQSLGPAEFYPKVTAPDADWSTPIGEWEVSNTLRTRATFENRRGFHKYLQLARLPVRQITDLRVDPSARHGTGSSDFGSGTVWTSGTNYHVEWDADKHSGSGSLIAVGAWPTNLGTIKVTYRAGYSASEFAGQATASSTASDGTITTQGVDASPIKTAAMLCCMAAYHELAAWSESTLTGLLVPGPKSSERLGDYSYSVGNPQAAALIAGMLNEVPPKAAQLMEDFRHYGLMVL